MEALNLSPDEKLHLDLQFQSSDGLKHLLKELIKPQIRSAFTERILFFSLRPETPVTVAIDATKVDRISPDMHNTILAYTKNIENISSREHMYNRSLHLASELGYYEYPDKTGGVNLRLKLALTAMEACHLFAPPFDAFDSGRAYIITNLPESALIPGDERSEVLNDIRHRLGAIGRSAHSNDKAPDAYYVSRPVIRRRHINIPDNQR